MHRITAIPGGWNPDGNGVIFIEQNPASIIFLTAADTDIQTVAASLSFLPSDFPSLRVVNLLNLQQNLTIDSYVDTVLSYSKIIILRLLGGRSYWSYGLEILSDLVISKNISLFVLPGDDRPNPNLMSLSTVSLAHVNRLWRYFQEGGVENFTNGFKFVADVCLDKNYQPQFPQVVPKFGMYFRQEILENKTPLGKDLYPTVGIIFYRSHYLSGNTKPIDALCFALQKRNLQPIAIFVSSLKDGEIQEELLDYCRSHQIQLLLNTTSFAIAKLGEEMELDLWQNLDIPIFQVILCGTTLEQWESSFQGLSPKDVAMNVALPEVDGRIITRGVSFKSISSWNDALETDVVIYQPLEDRINFVADLAANWLRLITTPPSKRKIALILANYPNKDGRIANGVGLDTPASCIEILKALKNAGYFVENIPENGDDLISLLTQGITNDLEANDWRLFQQDFPHLFSVSDSEYLDYFATLPPKIQEDINKRWGEFQPNSKSIPISGIQLGNIFVGIQPSRGYDLDPSLNYHVPDLEPTHHYLAFYYWLKTNFHTLAMVHIGKHGNLEWLPGKSIALSANCYPEISLGSLPNFYPFIVNDPGEGAQAKRRSQAVILDHLTPPMTRAELYGNLQKLERLIDEYYEAQSLDPSRLKVISERILNLVNEENLNKDLGINTIDSNSISQFLNQADGYLCELKEAQIRDGLHVFGQCPQDNQLRDLIISIARFPNQNRLGLTQAIAQDFHLNFDPLNTNPADNFAVEDSLKNPSENSLNSEIFQNNRTIGDAIETLEEIAKEIVDNLLYNQPTKHQIREKTKTQLQWIQNKLLPTLQQSQQEITNLIRGLEGKYIPSGPSGAPTRGRIEVLPTGRNFYSVDIRAIPTETAWEVGRKAAEAAIERYTQENGEYPKTLAISIWGTSTMRTGGDDVAEVLALLGVKPIWDGNSRRVVDFEILTPSALGRPRVDVTVRVSGFFRDSFPNLIDLLYQVTRAIARLQEEKDINPLASQVAADREFWQGEGLNETQARERAEYRIFGSKPGAYGAGLQGLIEAQNWDSDEDLARAYINWSCYAYKTADKIAGKASGGIQGVSMPEVFQQRLRQLQIVLHNQDNREHDLLDSDDYYQFQGGLTAAVRSLTGKNPHTYFGDNSLPFNPKVRSLSQEISRVYRSRVVNPKWIAGVMRHGYKGAFEMAATIDYLFAYDATAKCVEDFMYQGVADAYLFDDKVQKFILDKNPWALRDMAERLLEASIRGLWASASESTLDKLRDIVHFAEGNLEDK